MRALCSGNRWGVVHFEPCCSPSGFADCVWAMGGVADRRAKDGHLPICRRLDSLTLKAAAAQHSSVGSLAG
jgi:hypothetical protein